MRALYPVRPHDYSAQLIIAAFDRWQDLSSALEPIGAKEGCCFRAVLHARKDLPEDLGLREAVNEIAELGCNASGQPIATGEGALTSALAAAFSQGARDVAGALRQWMSRDQARQLESHLAHGRVLLWVQPLGSEEFSCVCGHLARTSPHVVEVCDALVKDGSQPGQSHSESQTTKS
jgi:hypothetical protein